LNFEIYLDLVKYSYVIVGAIMNCENSDEIIRRKKKKNIGNIISKILIIFGSFIIYFIADGTSLSFGIHIREIKKYFQTSTTKSSVTGSLMQSIPLFLSPFVCVLIERYGCRVIAFCGATVFTTSFILTKFFVTDLLSLYLILGFLASCGLAMCYIPAYLILSFHFDKKRATAIGIAVSGSGVGVL
jgi:MFS family permease